MTITEIMEISVTPSLRFIAKAFIEGVVFSGGASIFVFMFRKKFEAVIQFAVKYYYDTKLEEYKSNEAKRQKSILVAELIAEWLSNPDDRNKLNQLSFEAFVWLPKDIALALSSLLAHEENAPGVKEILAQVRVLILGEKEEIDSNMIIHFNPKVGTGVKSETNR